MYATMDQNTVISWMGVILDDDGCENVYVSLMKRGDHSSRELMLVEVANDSDHLVRIRSGESRPKKIIDGIIPHSGKVGMRRLASTMGWNIGSRGAPGPMQLPTEVGGCSCTYDIEVSTNFRDFPLPDSKILSCAIYCSCGFKLTINTMGVEDENVVAVDDSPDLVRAFIDAILDHRPQWLVGWNNFYFDNSCLAFFSSSDHDKYFEAVVVVSTSGNKETYIIDIPMVYNIDMYVYMDRSPGRRSRYKNMSLATVAEQEDVLRKTSMPRHDGESMSSEMVMYNMNDSMVTYEIWKKLNIGDEILSLSCVSCTPVQDTCRYITGRFGECAVASYCYTKDLAYCWQEHEDAGKFTGGYVMNPVRGIHSDVAVCDFKSMYPTLFACCNIAPESLFMGPMTTEMSEGSITWNDKCVTFCYQGKSHSFASGTKAILPEMQRKMMSERDLWRKKKPYYAGSLKIVANSMYGICGYSKSPMYSPSCSQSITLAGRWCTVLTVSVFSLCGMEVIYGDTDSVMVKTKESFRSRYKDVEHHRTICIDILHRVLSYTPFYMMHLEREPVHKRMLVMEKKMYATMSSSGEVNFKGISTVRKDSMGICRNICNATVRSILQNSTEREACREITMVACKALDRSSLGLLTVGEISSTIRSGGMTVYKYQDSNEEDKEVPVTETDIASIVPYNRKRMSRAIVSEVSRYTRAAGYGGFHDAMIHCDPFAAMEF